MKPIFLIKFLLILFSINVLAQNPNVSGVYVGEFSCGRDIFQSSLKIVHNSDNSLKVVVYSYDPRYNKKTEIGTRANFSSYGTDIIIESPRMNDKMIINFQSDNKRIRVRFDEYRDRCGEYFLKKDSKLTKELLSEIKKEQTSNAQNSTSMDISYLNGYWLRKLENNGEEGHRLIVENKQAWFEKTGYNGFLLSLIPEQFIPRFEDSEGGAIIFRFEKNNVKNFMFDKLRVVINPLRLANFKGDYQMGAIQVSLLNLEGKWISYQEFEKPFLLDGRSNRAAGGIFYYQDWQNKISSNSVSLTESSNRLRQTFDSLNKTGDWRCLSQRTVIVRPGESSRISWKENLTQRAYIIFSPNGNSNLIYQIATPSTNSIVKLFDSYPVLITSSTVGSPFNTEFTFNLKPNVKANQQTKEIEVTVFRLFGNAPGDYGSSNCSY